MEKNLLLCNLYDCYGNLLTEKQKQYFENYYFNNLTLSEMSENYNVSRNAIYNLLKETEKKLFNYEEKLKFYEKKQKIQKIINNLDDKTKEELERIILD